MFVGRWMFTHWPLTWSPCARSEMQAHLPVTSEEGKKWEGGGGGKKSTHWKVANYSHRNLTLAGWLQPRSRWFCTWNSARCYFWDVTWWRNPRGSDRSRTLIQNPPPTKPPAPPPIHSALHFIPSFPLTSVTEQTQAFLTRTEDVTTTKPFKKQQECFMYENHTLKTFIGWYPINVHKCKIRSEQGRATLCERQSREILKSRDQTAWHSLLKQPWRDPFSSSQHHQLTYIPPSSQPAPPHLHSDITRLVIWQRAWSESPRASRQDDHLGSCHTQSIRDHNRVVSLPQKPAYNNSSTPIQPRLQGKKVRGQFLELCPGVTSQHEVTVDIGMGHTHFGHKKERDTKKALLRQDPSSQINTTLYVGSLPELRGSMPNSPNPDSRT